MGMVLRDLSQEKEKEKEKARFPFNLWALPEDHLAKFHKMTDAKEMWDAIKSRFCGNDESKKMQKYILKQQFEASVSTEDANHKFLRSLPSAWSQVSLIMRTKPGVDSLSFDDLEHFCTNDVRTVYGVSILSASYNSLLLDEFDLREMDSEMAGGHDFNEMKRSKGNQDNRKRDAWNSGNKDGIRFGSDTEVTSCSNECKESYAKLKKLYDAQREQLSDASIEIKAYTQGLKKVEAQLGAHQQGQHWHMTGKRPTLLNITTSNGGLCFWREVKEFSLFIAKATVNEILTNGIGGKRTQHKASWKAKSVSSFSHSLKLLHMDLFGPTSVRSINHKTYCHVITDDFSRSKEIKREYSNARTPQQNGVAERKNRTLIEATRTMLEDSFLPNTFWAEAVSTACYVLNRVLVTKPQNNTPYELITVKSSEAKNEGEKPNKNTNLKINEKLVDQEDQAFLDELERLKRQKKKANDVVEALRKEFAQETEDLLLQTGATRASSTNTTNTASTPVSTASPSGGLSYIDQNDSQIPALEDIYDSPNDDIFTNAFYDDEGAVADFTNLETIVNVDAMQEELLQFKIQKVWILIDLSYGKKAIRTKWVYRNKKDERGVVVRNKGLFGLCFLYGIHSLSDGCEECLLVWFSRKETLLFQTMAVQDQAKMGEDEAVNEEMDDSLVRASTTATSLDAEHGSAPRGNTLRSGEDRLKLKELMELCTNLQTRVLNLETTKTTQANEIVSLKRRVKKQERRNRSRTHGLKRLYRVGSSRRVESSEDEGLGEEDASKQGRIADIDANEDIYLVNVQTDEDMFGVNNLNDDEVIVKISAAITTTTTTAMTDVEINLAQSLAELKSAKPKADKVVIQEPEQDTTTTPTLTTTTAATTIIADSTRPKAKGIVKVQDKGKGKIVELKPVKKMSKKDLLRLDEELAFKLQAEEEEEEERLAIEKA
ncbi:putative ribonuclease H-like domain-containing protein [Tanacetum coccineum]